MSFAVVQRQREMGLRLALGARRSQVFSLVMARGVTLAIIGAGLGGLGALWASRALEGLLFGVGRFDPTVWVAVASLLALVAIFATALPARRATRVDPLELLRVE